MIGLQCSASVSQPSQYMQIVIGNLNNTRMKRNILKTTLFFGLILTGQYCFAQKIGTDSKGKSIFSFYSLNDYRLEFDTEEPFSLGFSTYRFKTTFTIDADTTVVKNSGIYVNLSMLNSDDYINFKNLSEMRPGAGFKIGWQKSIEKFQDIDRTPGGTYSWGINAFFNFDNIKLYNPLDSLTTTKLPLTYGLESNFTYFSKSKFRNMIAINLSYNRTWNDDELLNFQTIDKTTIANNIVALEDFEGRYGLLSNEIDKVRLSTSFPFYIGYLNPIPYLVLNVSSNSAPKYSVGTFINILTKKLEVKDFNIPSSFGLGIDWTYSANNWTKPSIFMRGAINFGKFK